MALVKLGDKAVGSIVKLNVGGTATEFLVVHQGLPGTMYDASCNGTWLLMKDIYEKCAWNNSNVNKYESGDLDSYLNSTFLGLFDADIQAVIIQAKIPYRQNGGLDGTIQNGSNGLARKIFLLSAPEVNFTHADIDTGEGAALSYFASCVNTAADSERIAYLNDKAFSWWLRSPVATTYVSAWVVSLKGNCNGDGSSHLYGVRPALILPSSLLVSDDGIVTTNTPPETPSAITVPSQVNGGSTITVEWGASSDAEDNLEGYKVERSVDGGSTWSQIYQGAARSTTNTVPFGTESVMYRVKAYDSEGLESGYRTSGQVTVINNTAPTTPSYITVPEQVRGGQPLTITWGASTDGENNLAGYSLERCGEGVPWAVVYSGSELSFTDQIPKGWTTVAYRVRAYDIYNAYSVFAVSKPRDVDNNTPPAIVCKYHENTSLGIRNAGFAIPYTVEDEEGGEVVVTEAVDGAVWRTFTAELGAENRFALGGMDFMRLLNGWHTLAITAADDTSSAVHNLGFNKLVTAASVTLEQPMPADGPITVCVLSVSGDIPADAAYQVEDKNTGLDEEPVWEDCTAAVRAGANIIFENEEAANGFAFNFRLVVERGPSGVGGCITSVQGGFQGQKQQLGHTPSDNVATKDYVTTAITAALGNIESAMSEI